MIKGEVWDGVCEHMPFIVQDGGQIVSFFFFFLVGDWHMATACVHGCRCRVF